MLLKIVIIEDEVLIAENIAEICQESGHHVCDIAYNAGQGLLAIKEFQPDLVLLDIHLNDEIDGLEIGKKITKEWNIPIIYITSYADKETLNNLGAINPFTYIVKPFHPAQLASSLQVAAMKIDKMKTNISFSQINLDQYLLSDREKEILVLLLKGVNSKDISSKIFISTNTVKYHLKNIFSKLDVHSKTELMSKFVNK